MNLLIQSKNGLMISEFERAKYRRDNVQISTDFYLSPVQIALVSRGGRSNVIITRESPDFSPTRNSHCQ